MVAALVFGATTAILLFAMSGATYLLLQVLVGEQNRFALGFAIAIYSPVLALYLVVSVAVGLWLSRFVYRRSGPGEIER